jgi:ribonuclease E
LAYTKNSITDEQRPLHGQSLPLGDTGDGNTGVPSDEQGISNRPGDLPEEMSAQKDETPDADEEDEDELDLDDEDDDESDEDDDEEVDEQTDPKSEPGKPI